jgi:REP element-mobilizing transposase RayT
MKGLPICLSTAHAEAVLEQFLDTARIRGWEVRAVAIMHNHFHMVVGVAGDPAPSKILGDFKSWGTRKLSQKFGMPISKTWGASRRKPDVNVQESIERKLLG